MNWKNSHLFDTPSKDFLSGLLVESRPRIVASQMPMERHRRFGCSTKFPVCKNRTIYTIADQKTGEVRGDGRRTAIFGMTFDRPNRAIAASLIAHGMMVVVVAAMLNDTYRYLLMMRTCTTTNILSKL
jgi:hypothetical protein